MYDTIRFNFASDNGLKFLLGAIMDYFSIDATLSLQEAEDGSFSPGDTASFPFDTFSAKV